MGRITSATPARAVVAASLLLLATACLPSASPQESASTVKAGTPQSTTLPGSGTPTQAAASGVIGQAQLKASQYDYDAAIKLLQGETSADATAALAKIRTDAAAATQWADNSQVSHIFYHALIVDPARAFDKNKPKRAGYAQYMVTLHEFTAQMQQIYDKGYVLVHPEDLASEDASGTMRYTPIKLAPGKKPLVLSIDDTSYYEYMTGDGFATNLVVKADGTVTNTYTDAAGVTTQGSYDVPPVVDDFVRAHPDFSYHGAKGSIALTGYNGVLGYRTSVREYGDTAATQDAQKKAKVVADALKASGWNFADHSWGHIDMTKSSLGTIQADIQRWNAEVKPIIGPTKEMIFAFGADIGNSEKYSAGNPKFAFLNKTEGYRYFFPIDSGLPAWAQLTPTALRQARINIDGITIQRALDGKKTVLTNFFDVKSTLDPLRPLPLPK